MQDWWQATFPQGRQSLTITDANGYPVQIAYGEKGTGKPLFLIHGIGSWSYNWRHSVEPLSQYFRVICFDAKGYGFSEKPLAREKVGHQIIELQRIIKGLCDEPAVVVAESLGALNALAVAQEYPQLVAQLVVVNVPIFPIGLPNLGMWLLSRMPLEAIQAIDYSRVSYLLAPLLREIMAIERRTLLHNPETLTPEDVYWMTYPFVELPGTLSKVTEDLHIATQEIENLQVGNPSLIAQIQNRLGAIKCPTLILWGEKDRWYPPSDGRKLHSCIPHSQLKILLNCDHDASSGATEAVNAAILAFLPQ
jgi:pimeloyl-ACP methyl ester carboxylesterase